MQKLLMNTFLLLLVITLTNCNETKEQVQVTSTLSNDQWEALIQLHFDEESSFQTFSEPPFQKLKAKIDYVKRHGNRVILVMSKINDTIGVFQGYLMEYDHYHTTLFYAEIENRVHSLAGDSLIWYINLRDSDSLWSIFGENEFWNSDESWDSSYESLKLKNGNSNDSYYRESGHNVGHIIKVDRISRQANFTEPIGDDLLGLILTTQIAKHRSFQDKSNKLTIRQEYLVRNNNRFCAIVSKRSETEGVFKAIVGKQVKDSLFYKFIKTDNSRLTDSSMELYLERLDSNTLWKYFGEYGFWEDEKTFEEFYESASSETFSAPIN